MRPDGTLVKHEDPMYYLIPHFLTKRYDAMNMITLDIPEMPMRAYMNEKRKEGKQISHLALVLTAYLHTLEKYPALNRFIKGRKIYQHKDIKVSMVVLKPDGGDTMSKIDLLPTDDVFDVQEKITAYIDQNRQTGEANSLDKAMNIFVEKLGGMNLTMDAYERMTLSNIKYQENFKALYGEDSELVSDEDALSYLKENGYMSANHILIMTKDPSTGEELSDSDKADKKAKADEIYKELAAITDQSELMKRFAELKEEYCEDTGKTAYPDGYTFTEGKMVPEFENAVKALGDYEVSEPVQSDYGYHIILRLPDDPDSVIDYTSQNTPMTARKYWANADYAERMEAVLGETKLEYVPGFAQIELADFIK